MSQSSLAERQSRFTAAIRYLQERILVFILGVAILATSVSMWSVGRMQSAIAYQDFIITDLNEDVATLQVTVFQLEAGQCPKPQGESDEQETP